MIAGLEKISDGTLVMDGKTMNDVQSCDRDIAMVFQNYALYPHMTVAENMAYSLRLKHVPKKERRQKVEEVARQSSPADRSREWPWGGPLCASPRPS